MSKQVIEVWNVEDASKMLAALTVAIDAARAEGHRPDTVYLNKGRLTLVRETLTDGSQVMNINFFDAIDSGSSRAGQPSRTDNPGASPGPETNRAVFAKLSPEQERTNKLIDAAARTGKVVRS